MAANDKSRERLMRELANEITGLFEQALDFAEVACATKDTYKVLRSKILRVGNNTIRNVEKKIKHYNIEFVANSEDFIEIKSNIEK